MAHHRRSKLVAKLQTYYRDKQEEGKKFNTVVRVWRVRASSGL